MSRSASHTHLGITYLLAVHHTSASPCRREPSGRTSSKRDTHCGCLGHGDLEGRLVPTMLKGEDDIVQVGHGGDVGGEGGTEQMATGAAKASRSRLP